MTISPLLASVQRREKTLQDAASLSEHAYVHKGVLTEQRKSESEAVQAPQRATRPTEDERPSRVREEQAQARAAHDADDFQTRRRTKQILVSLFREVDTHTSVKMAGKMELCGSSFTVITCGAHIPTKYPRYRCEKRHCPYCAARRSRDLQTEYLPKAYAYPMHAGRPVAPCFLTLTQTVKKGETLSAARVRLMASFKNLQRRALWRTYFDGGIWAIEATITDDGSWHCHLHGLMFRRKFFDVKELKVEWLDVTGDSHVVNLTYLDPTNPDQDIKSALQEIIKYVTKPKDADRMTVDHARQLLALHRARMFGTVGEFHKFCRRYKPTEAEVVLLAKHESYTQGDLCPTCSKPLASVCVSEDRLVDLLYRVALIPPWEVAGRTKARKGRGSPL